MNVQVPSPEIGNKILTGTLESVNDDAKECKGWFTKELPWEELVDGQNSVVSCIGKTKSWLKFVLYERRYICDLFIVKNNNKKPDNNSSVSVREGQSSYQEENEHLWWPEDENFPLLQPHFAEDDFSHLPGRRSWGEHFFQYGLIGMGWKADILSFVMFYITRIWVLYPRCVLESVHFD